MLTILGAGGAVSGELVKLLDGGREPVRLVGRSAHTHTGAESMLADLTDAAATMRAIDGSRVALLLVGLPYNRAIWRERWPRIMRNCVDACKRTGARLLFFDNVYMYGRVDGAMTEETPFSPCSVKGEVRAHIATMLLEEMAAGKITAMIARAADFYGPGVRNSVPNTLIFDKLAAGSKPMWVGSDAVPHSFTYIPDAARALVRLINEESAWGQTWHLPTAPAPPTGREFIAMAAEAMQRPAKYSTMGRFTLRVGGLFNSIVRELPEMYYQNEFAYVFDSTKYTRAFGEEATPYADGIRASAAFYQR